MPTDSKTPAWMRDAKWTPVPAPQSDSDLPHVTHEGKVTIGSITITVLQLSDGKRIIPADEMERIFGL